jgi:hypothetical protein
MLVYLGILVYSPHVMECLMERKEIDDNLEIEIRGCSIQAVDVRILYSFLNLSEYR